jgi:hypothetical protein
MAVQRGIRRLGITNQEALDELADFAASLPPVRAVDVRLTGQDVPVRLSKVRILDIILWSDVAIHDEHHQSWTRWYAEEVAASE